MEQNISHSEMVARLVKPGVEIAENLTAASAHLWHMATGISGEAGELLEAFFSTPTERAPLDYENITEELGDLEFYIEGVRQELPTTLLEFEIEPFILNSRYHAIQIAIRAGQVLDAVKKFCIYNKPLDVNEVKRRLAELDANMASLRHLCGITREVVIAHNIAKLSKRYHGLQYSDTSAQARADKSPAPPIKWSGMVGTGDDFD